MMARAPAIAQIPSGIEGFDFLAHGGLPAGRATLVAGTAGSGKTLFAARFLAAGVELGESAVFVTFEETPAAIRENVAGLDWDIAGWEAAGQWRFVDVSPTIDSAEVDVGGHWDLQSLTARIKHAAQQTGALRVVLDSLAALFSRLGDAGRVRGELLRLIRELQAAGLTTIITIERRDEEGAVDEYGVEAFVADAVVVLRNHSQEEMRRRTVEILKFRGLPHQRGEFPFTIMPEIGLSVVPLAALELNQNSGATRRTSGSAALDELCGGGWFGDSITLVSGSAGCGKTLLATQFLVNGAREGDRCLFLGFEEGHDQLLRNATSWGMDIQALEASGEVRVEARYPETSSLEEHLISIKRTITEYQPQRVVVDSLSALERAGSERAFRQFSVALGATIKSAGAMALATTASPSLVGGESVTSVHVSSLADTIILMRYLEVEGVIRRGMVVLKMRGSKTDHAIREYVIDDDGLQIGAPFNRHTGLLGSNG